MKIRFPLVIIIFCLAILRGQDNKIVLDSPYEVFPLYYKAIESASSHNLNLAKAQLQTVVNMVPFHHNASIYLRLCNDIIKGRISKHSGFSIFTSIHDLQNGNDTLQVIRTLNNEIDSNNNYSVLFLIRGNIFCDLGDYPSAILDYTRAIEIDPVYKIGLFFKGRTLLLLERSDEALENFQAVTRQDPNFVPALIGEGKILYKKGNIEEAYTILSHAMQINPVFSKEFKLLEIFNAAGIYFLDTGDNQSALKALDYAISIGDDWSEPFLNRGITYRNMEKYISAISDFDHAIALDSTFAAAYYHRGLCYIEIQNLKQAAKDLEISTQFDEENLQYLNSLGKFYFDQRQDEKSIPIFMKVLQYNESDIWANYWIAFSYDRLKDYRNAVNYYRQFISGSEEGYGSYKKHAQKRMKQIEVWLKSQSDF